MTPDQEARAIAALERIADKWDFRIPAPAQELYDDTESAYNNGEDCATFRCAEIAQRALVDIGRRQKVEPQGYRCEQCGSVAKELVKNEDGTYVCDECRPDLFK
jgi:hypothetical protein